MRIEPRRLVHAFRARATSALLAALILIGGSSRASAAPRRPVILIPGLLGSVLERQDTRRQIWGNYFRLSFASPHRGLVDPTYDGLELPTASTNLRDNRDSLVPTGLLERMTLIPHLLSVKVYAGWVESFQRAGYRLGDIEHPTQGDDCFVFSYDWRRDLVESAQLLAQRVDAIRKASGDPQLKVDLIAHSMGGLIVRYYLLYGGEDVLGSATPPEPTMEGAAHVAHAVLLATPNEGSMVGFENMLRGARIGLRSVSPLVLFTMPSCFEVLPAPGDPVFVDGTGATCPLDLYDPATWVTHRWSIYDPDLRKTFRRECDRRFGRQAAQAYDAKYDEWAKYLAAMLARARRFQMAIAADKRVAVPVAMHLFGGDCLSTVSRSIVATSADGVSPSTSKRPNGMSRRQYAALTRTPGDGRVARTSVAGQPTSSGPQPSAPSIQGASLGWSCVEHDRIQNDAQIQRSILTVLLAGTTPSVPQSRVEPSSRSAFVK